MIDGNKLAGVGFAYLGVSYSKMDCQAFVEQCLRDCGLNKNLPGSNAWFREVYKNGAIMTPEECVKQLGTVPPGAFLFILEHDGKEPEKYKKDGLGNASHIGIVTGRSQGAIHSSCSKGCVCESKFQGKTIKNGGWNRVGLWDQVVYDYGGSAGSGNGSSVGTGETDDTGFAVTDLPEDPIQEPKDSSAPVIQQEFATVWAPSGSTVNTRQGPGMSYDMSKAGRVPIGTVVEILKRRSGWARIRYTDPRNATWYCWMKEEYLKADGGVLQADSLQESEATQASSNSETFWSVTISHLTESEMRALEQQYPGALSWKEESV